MLSFTFVPVVQFHDDITQQPIWRPKFSTPVYDDLQRIEGPAAKAKEVGHGVIEKVIVEWLLKIRAIC